MPQFSPDSCTFNDYPGMGVWDDSHHREHQQFVAVLGGLTTPVLIPNYDFLQLLTAGHDRGSIINTHQQAHALLASITGTQSVDFSQYNFDDEQSFYDFLGIHGTIHSEIRQALGVT